jgi:hypothetical protein
LDTIAARTFAMRAEQSDVDAMVFVMFVSTLLPN